MKMGRSAVTGVVLGLIAVVLGWRTLDARTHVATWDTGWADGVTRQACFAYAHSDDGSVWHSCMPSMSECDELHQFAVDRADNSDVSPCRLVSRAPSDLRTYHILIGMTTLAMLGFTAVASAPLRRRLAVARDDAWRARNM